MAVSLMIKMLNDPTTKIIDKKGNLDVFLFVLATLAVALASFVLFCVFLLLGFTVKGAVRALKVENAKTGEEESLMGEDKGNNEGKTPCESV